MARRLCVLLGAAGIIINGARVRAEGSGALPHGEEAPDGAPAKAEGEATDGEAKPDAGAKAPGAAKTVKPSQQHRNCFLDLTEPPGGNGRFALDGKSLYLLAQVGAPPLDDSGDADKKKKKDAKKKAKDSPKVKYALLKINPKTHKTDRLVAFDHLTNAQLLTLGHPLKSATAITFSGRTAGCFAGPASAISLSFDKSADKAVHAIGQFELVEVPEGRMLIDLKKSVILNIDPTTFQTKAARKIPVDERPLYFDPEKKRLVTWTAEGPQRGLAAYEGEDDNDPLRLPVKRGDRILQNGGFFAIAHLDQLKNIIDIEEVPKWSGTAKGAHFKLTVPPAYPVSTAGIDINFKKRVALVFGANFAAKQKWQRVFVFDYGTGNLLGGVPVTGTQYLNYAGIDPTGAFAVVEVRDNATRQTIQAKLFDVSKKNFDDIDLGLKAAADVKDGKEKDKDKDKDKDSKVFDD